MCQDLSLYRIALTILPLNGWIIKTMSRTTLILLAILLAVVRHIYGPNIAVLMQDSCCLFRTVNPALRIVDKLTMTTLGERLLLYLLEPSLANYAARRRSETQPFGQTLYYLLYLRKIIMQ